MGEYNGLSRVRQRQVTEDRELKQGIMLALDELSRLRSEKSGTPGAQARVTMLLGLLDEERAEHEARTKVLESILEQHRESVRRMSTVLWGAYLVAFAIGLVYFNI